MHALPSLFLLLTLAGASARDVILSQPAVVRLNSSCTEYYLPTLQLCTDCTVRTTTLTVEPHSASPTQVVTVTAVGGAVGDTVIIVDNTGFAEAAATRTTNGYILCANGKHVTTGFTVALDVLMQKLPVPLPPPPALTVTNTWTSPDRDAAYVQIQGVAVDTTACIHAGTTTDLAECMQLCTAMTSCTNFILQGSVCDLCSDAAALTKTWTLQTTTPVSVFLRGKSLHLYIREPVHAVTTYVSAFPGQQRTLSAIFTMVAMLLVAVSVFLGVFGDIADVSMTFDRTCQLRNNSTAIVDGVLVVPGGEHGHALAQVDPFPPPAYSIGTGSGTSALGEGMTVSSAPSAAPLSRQVFDGAQGVVQDSNGAQFTSSGDV
jgi:hypothetical protein